MLFFPSFFFPLYIPAPVGSLRIDSGMPRKYVIFFIYIPAPVCYFFPVFFFPLHTCTSRVIAHRLRHAIFPNNNVPSESVRLRESKKKNLKDSIQK